MTHKHHVIPRHEWKLRFGNLRGFNAPDNIVYLTTNQHSQAHQFLYELNGNKFDLIACRTLSGQMNRDEALELARLEKVKIYFNDPLKREEFSKKCSGRIPWNKGKRGIKSYIRTQETIDKIKKARAKQVPPTLGFRHTKESKDKMRSIALGKNASKRFNRVREI